MGGHIAIGRPIEILLVEDSITDARLTIGALKKGPLQHHLTLLRNGQEAVNFLDRRGPYTRAPQPDLVLLDLLLPGRDGVEVLTEIQKIPRLENVAVVVLTASENLEAERKCREMNVRNYLTKPVNRDKFYELVKNFKSTYWRENLQLWAMLEEEEKNGK